MQSKIVEYLNSKVSRQLWWALIFSIVLHLFFLNGLNLVLPSMNEESSVITAELVLAKVEKNQPPIKKDIKKEIQKKIKPKVEKPPKLAEKIPEKTPEPTPELNNEIDQLKPVIEPLPPEEAIDANNPEYIEDKIDVASKPTNIESWYDVRRSIGGSKVGETHITYKIDKGHYKIESVSEAKGFASLIYSGQLIQTSEGELTEYGLKPSSFFHQYDKKDSKTYKANFFWIENTLTLITSKGPETVELPMGTQDILSVQYQFMFLPPLQNMELYVTTGKTLRDYAYEFEGEEIIKTNLGEFNTIHIVHRGEDDNDKTEMWLAEEYHYLPIRLRKYLKDGSMLVQEMRKTNLVKVPRKIGADETDNTELPPL